MKKKAEKIKMFLLMKIVVIVTILTSLVACDEEITVKKSNESQTLNHALGDDSQKVSNENQTRIGKNWGDRLSRPFFYGKKFEVKQELSEKKKDVVQEEKLITPLITRPIRTLSLKSQLRTDWNILRQNQNDILNSVRDSLSKRNDENLSKFSFAEEASESENIGSEASTDIAHNNENTSKENSNSKSSKDSDQSLLVVYPFKAKSGNMEELFTKKPFVQVLDASESKRVEVKSTEETTDFSKTSKKFIQKRWRPRKAYGTTEPASTKSFSTESDEEATKTYTNYNDVEQVTRKFEMYGKYSEEEENHNYEDDLTFYNKRLTNKIPDQKETDIDESFTTSSSIEDLEFVMEEEKQTSTFRPKSKGQREKLTSAEGLPKPTDISKVLEILPLDMKEVFEQIELNKENKNFETAHKNVYNFKRLPQPTIDPKSYSKFRPLPLELKDSNRQFVSDEMKNLLESFGLLPIASRVQKSLREKSPKVESKPIEEISEENLDFLTEDLKSVLEDMGLLKNNGKREPTRIHIFNPSNHTMARTDEDRLKLNAILSSIKTTVNNSQSLTPESQVEIIQKIKELDNLRYKNRNLTEINNEIQKIVEEKKSTNTNKQKTTKRATKLFEGPDPVYFVEESLLKNDVKRQDISNASLSLLSSASSSSSSLLSNSSANDTTSLSTNNNESSDTSQNNDSETVNTTTEENINLEALRQSFGGGETAPDDADVESELPPKRPNGLYFLFDWNSFLEVGSEEDGGRRVQLRFQPKVGDPRNFLSVTIP